MKEPGDVTDDARAMTDKGRVVIRLLETGVPNLDVVLGGGLPALSFTILGGGPGTGKTTLAQQMLFHVGTAERPALYFSILGEPTAKLLRYQQQFAFFTPARVGRDVLYVDLADAVRTGGTAQVLQAITAEVERCSPGLIAIDSFRAIQELAQAGGSSLRAFAHDLALLLAAWDTTSLLIGEYRWEDIDLWPEFTICDGILWLNQEVRQNSVTRKLQVVKLRGAASLPGRHTFRLSGAGVHIYPRLLDIAETPATARRDRATFGVAGLDQMLGGGLPRGEACLIAGSSGTGKTLLALHFIVAGAAQGEAGVMVTFEEQPEAHMRKARSFGWDLAQLERQNLLRMIYLRPVDLSVDEVLGEINRAVQETGATRVVINSISGFELAIAPTEKEDFREGLYRLIANLTSHGTTVVMTTEVADLFGEVRITTYGISFIADSILLLRYVEIESELRKAVMVIKMRTSDHEKMLRQYHIGSHGVEVEAPFSQYSGVLSGIPTLRALAGPQPYTPGLSEDEEALVYVLLSLRQASAQQLAEALNVPGPQVAATLDKLVDTGYVARSTRDGKTLYRVAMVMPGAGGRLRPGRGKPDIGM